MGNATITKIAQLSDKLSKSELNELEQQTQTKFIFKGVCGETDFYANCSDVFKIKYKRSGAQYLIKGLEVSENEFYKTYHHIWCILQNNNNIEFSQLTEWDSQRDLEAPYNMIPCAIKENEDMPKIVDYKYNEETGTTTLFWADKTQTTVTADNLTEANQFEGFCAACAKKLFGNKSTYLNQFDKWAVRKPEQERKKAEAEKIKAEEQAKIEAEKAECAKARKIKRIAKKWATQYKNENENDEIYEAAMKMAKEKYNVPTEWFEDTCGCDSGCKEFDNLNTDDISD